MSHIPVVDRHEMLALGVDHDRLRPPSHRHSPQENVRLAIAGMGGYAKIVTDEVIAPADNADQKIELVAVCDPQPESHGTRSAELSDGGIRVYNTFEALLQRRDIDAIWLPLPIQLHRPFAERALSAGKHVIVEKPAAGTVQDVDAMIDARNTAGRLCVVGFQALYRPEVRRLKKRLLSGELGRLKRASVVGCWPRSANYFARNAWAGRLQSGGAWVLDSVVNNAMAHFVNLALFLMGETDDASAQIALVEAEVYRAYDIETFDTCTLRVTTGAGVELLIALTHACETPLEPTVTLHTESAEIRLQHPDGIVYRTNGSEVTEAGGHVGPRAIADALTRRLQGDPTAPLATLESARVHTTLVNVVAETATAVRVPDAAFDVFGENGQRAIRGIEEAFKRCAAEGKLLHELNIYDWTRPVGVRHVFAGYQFEGRVPVEKTIG